MNVQQFLNEKVSQALVQAGAPTGAPALVRPSSRAGFGDYQANGVMGAAKKLKTNPRALAEQVIAALDLGDAAEKVEVAGPGFINIFLNTEWLAARAEAIYQSPRADVPEASVQTIAVDYSAPNVAKEMHVGHLRSTIIGDAVVRTLEFLGHNVIRCNHVGDWGTQFGMLIAHLEEVMRDNPDVLDSELGELEEFYRAAKQKFDADADFANRARQYVAKLQAGDPEFLKMWQQLVDVTMTQNQQNYERLGVSLTREHVMGESMYNPMLAPIVEALKAQGLAVEDDGAQVVFLDEFKNKNGDPMGVIVQKRDGGFLYTTTDLACAKYRVETFNADRILYYIDSRQAQHLQQAWTIARKGKLVPESVSLEHHAFGMMLGKDGKPFKTRAGGVVKLAGLLDEAEVRAAKLINEKNPDLSDAQKEQVVRAVAIGAVKYADLSKNRTTDYIFDWDQMLSFEGNTAPYLQYAYTRICSIFRKAGVDAATLQGEIAINEDAERALAMKLAQFSETIDNVAREGCPHLLCGYLYELAGAFMSFYEACPVNKEGVAEHVRASRLKLCADVAKILKTGLDLLGIETVEQM